MVRSRLAGLLLILGAMGSGMLAACRLDPPAIAPPPDPPPEPSVSISPLEPALAPSLAELQRLTIAGDWQAADRQTRLLMLQLSGREREGWLDQQSLDRLGCNNLRQIDRLWQQASGGKFGFGVQQQIWQETQNLDVMSDRVGWRQNGDWVASENLMFDLQAPVGHLPSGDGVGLWLDGMRVGRGFPLLSVVLQQCRI